MSEQDPNAQPWEGKPQPVQPRPWDAPAQWNSPPQWNASPGYGGQPPWGSPYSGQQPGLHQPQYVAPPKPGIVPLRPLSFGEILDGSFQTIRRNAAAMLGAALLAQTLATVVGEVLVAETESRGDSIGAWVSGMAPPEMVGLGIGLLIGAALLGLVSFFISIVLQGVMAVPVARSVLNWRTGFKKMWTLSRSSIGSLLALGGLQILAFITFGVVLVGATVLLVDSMRGSSALILVPLFLGGMLAVVWLSIRFLLTPAAIVVEERDVLDGLRRSWHLTRRNWWRIFGIVLVTSLLIGIIGQIVLIPLGLASGGLSSVIAPHGDDDGQRALDAGLGIASIIVTALIGAVGYAFQTSVMGLLYMDLRMRKEGLDLALQRQLESGNDADGVPGRGVAPELNSAGYPASGSWHHLHEGQQPYGPPAPYGPPGYRPPPPYGPPPHSGQPPYGPPPGYRPPPGAG
ncbi:glycerophosphoryl diester phosphodiesterase membrane domain-containing protein [Arthrobacter sp. B10-11]|uniref:DUF7847 domain-containing protein n=1 Tax=Arthrobacter sp. B10-11 TaxID=3081160 RepID=UPI002954807F|nr:glycerophosphoryl diester phosphodiesterase membrane domain-containing protein [Arthrobacter sp. B10-11]MDV8146521.1 glycerophosphoryl diester phosphodiesterase membrane domain-containing protein [Arthrobacter sp. B10-11]